MNQESNKESNQATKEALKEAPKKVSWKAKIILLLLGLFLGLLLLEGGLRLAGFVVSGLQTDTYVPSESSYIKELRYKRDDSYEAYGHAAPGKISTGKQFHKILCVGDSFANGGNARSFQTYPFYLFKMLEKSDTPSMVLNMGKCESTTFGAAQRIEHLFKNTNDPAELPDLVVFIVGSADKYNVSPGFRDDMKWVKVDWHKDPPRYWYQDLRLYKLYRYLKLAFSSRKLTRELKNRSLVTEKEILAYRELYRDFKDNHPRRPQVPEAEYNRTLRRLAADFKGMAIQHFSAANNEYNEFDKPEAVLNSITTGLVIIYAGKKRHDEALALILDVEKHFPREFWSDETLFYLRYNLFQIFQLQSKYTAEMLAAQLQRGLEKHPELNDLSVFKDFYDMVSNQDQFDQMVDQKRMATWDKIVTMCREKKVKIILQNYPSDYKSANRIIAAVAEKYDLPLIDNHRIFDRLIAEEGREKYLEDDDHCTPEGYEVLAGKVYELIREKKVLTPRS